MKNFYRLIQFVAQFVTLGLALAFVVSSLAPQWTARLREPSSADTPPPVAEPPPEDRSMPRGSPEAAHDLFNNVKQANPKQGQKPK